jgi:uncharacterized protein (DUF2141 family)
VGTTQLIDAAHTSSGKKSLTGQMAGLPAGEYLVGVHDGAVGGWLDTDYLEVTKAPPAVSGRRHSAGR